MSLSYPELDDVSLIIRHKLLDSTDQCDVQYFPIATAGRLQHIIESNIYDLSSLIDNQKIIRPTNFETFRPLNRI